MCGRYTVTVDPETLYGEFACVEDDEHVDLVGGRFGEYGGDIARPRYNIAPTDQVPVVLERATDHDRSRPIRRLEAMRWGLVPSWAKDLSVGNRMFNARVEGLIGDDAKPAFRNAVERRRCLVPASGYYEWRKLEAGGARRDRGGRSGGKGKTPAKQAYYITPADGSLMAFAGLWEFWRSPDGEPVRSTTVITVPATGAMTRIHDRMPLVLPREAWDAWLDLRAGPEQVRQWLQSPADAVLDTLELRPVGDRVGNVRNDDAELVERVQPAVALDEVPVAAEEADQPTLL
ncbi:MAG TPA: SOS response-associated peptidase [Nakamurella sp.]|nr:SOS response-associated peptidase [Nakamurella sp.]